jgi:hypothetical protein
MPAEHIALCDPYIWEDPRYIFRSLWLTRQHDRSRGPCASELVNNIFVVYIVAALLGTIITSFTQFQSATLITLLLATIYLIPIFLQLQKVSNFREKVEAFTAEPPTKGGFNATGVAPAPTQEPCKGNPNPFGNVLVSDLKYSPDGLKTIFNDVTSTESKIAMDDLFRVQWYSDPTDVFGKSQSQRQFVTQPSTTVPNDQKSYQEWLYKIPGKTCKEGNAAACMYNRSGSPIPWLN